MNVYLRERAGPGARNGGLQRPGRLRLYECRDIQKLAKKGCVDHGLSPNVAVLDYVSSFQGVKGNVIELKSSTLFTETHVEMFWGCMSIILLIAGGSLLLSYVSYILLLQKQRSTYAPWYARGRSSKICK